MNHQRDVEKYRALQEKLRGDIEDLRAKISRLSERAQNILHPITDHFLESEEHEKIQLLRAEADKKKNGPKKLYPIDIKEIEDDVAREVKKLRAKFNARPDIVSLWERAEAEVPAANQKALWKELGRLRGELSVAINAGKRSESLVSLGFDLLKYQKNLTRLQALSKQAGITQETKDEAQELIRMTEERLAKAQSELEMLNSLDLEEAGSYHKASRWLNRDEDAILDLEYSVRVSTVGTPGWVRVEWDRKPFLDRFIDKWTYHV